MAEAMAEVVTTEARHPPQDGPWPPGPLKMAPQDGNTQMMYAREVGDASVAPRHASDCTPRLLLIDATVGAYAKGRLLLSPWSAFKGLFPMHGTYFFQNEVFEDESAGEVRQRASRK